MQSISRTPSIYQIRHVESGKIYVGSAVNPRKRWRDHTRELQNGIHHSQYLQRAWDKYGKDSFVFEIIEPVLFVEDLILREQHWIDILHAADPKHGFNIVPNAGSQLGYKHTNETRAKVAERSRAQWADPVEREKLMAGRKAHYADPAFRENLSKKAKARFADPLYHAKVSEQLQSVATDPDARGKRAAKMAEYYADPEWRKRHSERTQIWSTDPAYRAKRSAQVKAQWADPEYRAVQMAKRKTKRDAGEL